MIIMIKSIIALPIIVAILWLVNGIRLIGNISEGDSIGYRPNTAVLMIDLQTVFWDSEEFGEETKIKAQKAIIDEINDAKERGFPIIAMRQEWSIFSTKILAWLTMKGKAIAGTKGTEIAELFSEYPDYVLTKRVQDSFETGELDTLLNELQVGTLWIVGLDTRYCVETTVKAALRRGYKVEVIEKGVIASDPEKGQKALEVLSRNGVVLR